MATPYSFRSILYATLAVAILPTLVACSSGNDGQEGVENRIKPVASFELPAVETEATPAVATEGEAAAEAPAVEAPASEAEAAAPAAGRDAPTVYALVCHTCHDIGLAGAPKKGDKAAWAPRIATGKEALYTAILKGKGAMPAKGGNPTITDAEAKGTVDYLVDLAK
ncbi:MAG: c-type cytochrome [Zoogloeaceae bacterium]|jgi:cytochrome c5|nr:c-type cytochrome [Zoogloeaceae bacterium]